MAESLQQFIERVHRQEYGQVMATLIGWLRDFDLAEDAMQDAMLAAVEHWPRTGVPQKPGAWLTTTARRKALDRLRQRRSATNVLKQLAEQLPHDLDTPIEQPHIPDDCLRLIFTCCHPALPLEQQLALTLHTLGGLTTAEIATAFLVSVPTMAQRLVRAKQKIKVSAIPFEIPQPHRMAERLDAVLTVIYLIFTAGYAASSGDELTRHELCAEAIRLCRVLELLIRRTPMHVPPAQQAEVLGLLAMMLLHDSRRSARLGMESELIPLPAQDRSRWDRRMIHEGLALLEKALYLHQPGPYQVQAAISALHAQATSAETTDWPQIVALYRKLCCYVDTPIIRLNHAVAASIAAGPAVGLRLLSSISPALDTYAPFHLAQADMLERSGQDAAAQHAYERALKLTRNMAEREYIRRKVDSLSQH
jgi:RNA polymerase sigma-70 factor (ECF subfamily)